MANQFPRPRESLGEPLTLVRGFVENSAVGVFTENTLFLPTNPANNIGFLIRRVILDMEPPVYAFPVADNITALAATGALSTRQGLAAVPGLLADGTIAAVELNVNVGSAPADAGVAISHFYTQDKESDYSVGGLLTATRELSLYISASAGITNVLTLQALVMGHIVQITAEELVAALSTEVGI